MKEFFGKGGLGLELKEECPGSLSFKGGGGHVTAAFYAEEEKTLLKIVTSGWAVPVKKFIDGTTLDASREVQAAGSKRKGSESFPRSSFFLRPEPVMRFIAARGCCP